MLIPPLPRALITRAPRWEALLSFRFLISRLYRGRSLFFRSFRDIDYVRGRPPPPMAPQILIFAVEYYIGIDFPLRTENPELGSGTSARTHESRSGLMSGDGILDTEDEGQAFWGVGGRGKNHSRRSVDK